MARSLVSARRVMLFVYENRRPLMRSWRHLEAQRNRHRRCRRPRRRRRRQASRETLHARGSTIVALKLPASPARRACFLFNVIIKVVANRRLGLAESTR